VGRFSDWLLTQKGNEYEAERGEEFTLRKHYGRYLLHVAEELRKLGSGQSPITVHYITNTQVNDLNKDAEGKFTLHCIDSKQQSNCQWVVNVVALCTGGFPSHKYEELIGCSNYSHDYSTHVQVMEKLRGDELVGVIGTRLTAVDIAVELERRSHRGMIVMGGHL